MALLCWFIAMGLTGVVIVLAAIAAWRWKSLPFALIAVTLAMVMFGMSLAYRAVDSIQRWQAAANPAPRLTITHYSPGFIPDGLALEHVYLARGTSGDGDTLQSATDNGSISFVEATFRRPGEPPSVRRQTVSIAQYPLGQAILYEPGCLGDTPSKVPRTISANENRMCQIAGQMPSGEPIYLETPLFGLRASVRLGETAIVIQNDLRKDEAARQDLIRIAQSLRQTDAKTFNQSAGR